MTKILVAYDGSEMSQTALQEAKSQLERQPDTELHVISVATMSGPTMNYPLAKSITNEVADAMRSVMKQLQHELEDEGIKSHCEVIVDYYQRNPGKMICQYAEDNKIDLIIVGSRGLGKMSGLFLGSVSHYIVQHASSKVLVIK